MKTNSFYSKALAVLFLMMFLGERIAMADNTKKVPFLKAGEEYYAKEEFGSIKFQVIGKVNDSWWLIKEYPYDGEPYWKNIGGFYFIRKAERSTSSNTKPKKLEETGNDIGEKDE